MSFFLYQNSCYIQKCSQNMNIIFLVHGCKIRCRNEYVEFDLSTYTNTYFGAKMTQKCFSSLSTILMTLDDFSSICYLYHTFDFNRKNQLFLSLVMFLTASKCSRGPRNYFLALISYSVNK